MCCCFYNTRPVRPVYYTHMRSRDTRWYDQECSFQITPITGQACETQSGLIVSVCGYAARSKSIYVERRGEHYAPTSERALVSPCHACGCRFLWRRTSFARVRCFPQNTVERSDASRGIFGNGLRAARQRARRRRPLTFAGGDLGGAMPDSLTFGRVAVRCFCRRPGWARTTRSR